jgi:hypothetical protein
MTKNYTETNGNFLCCLSAFRDVGLGLPCGPLSMVMAAGTTNLQINPDNNAAAAVPGGGASIQRLVKI